MPETVTKDKLVEDLQMLARDAEALLAATAGQAGEKLDSARAKAAASLKQAQQRLAFAEAAAMREVKAAAASTDAYVHDNPWQAVGVAAGIGLVIGLLIGRR